MIVRPRRPALPAAVRLLGPALLLGLSGCPRPTAQPPGPPDAAANTTAEASPDAGWALDAAHLEAWLALQRTLASLGPTRQADGGPATRDQVKARALAERALGADAGLGPGDVDRIEDVVAVFVAERNVERLNGSAAVNQFRAALNELSPEQRAKAEAAFNDATARAAPSPLPALEARFGPEVLQVLLAHEAEVTKTWDSLLER